MALPPRDRDAYLQQGSGDVARVPAPVRTRAATCSARSTRAIGIRGSSTFASSRRRRCRAVEDASRRSLREYLRAMRFLYQKEFVAQRAPDPADAVAALYRSRGLSTDTAVEAGYLVHLGLGVLKSLEPAAAFAAS